MSVVAAFLLLLLQDNLRFIGHDINVTGVWENNITGRGIVVSVIDDGKYISIDNMAVALDCSKSPIFP